MVHHSEVAGRGHPDVSRAEAGTLLAICALALTLNLYHNTFPLGYHIDEPKKVGFISRGAQDFHHPLLMLQLVRGANLVLQSEDPQAIVELGRTITGIVGALTILPTWWLGRRIGGPATGLLSAAAVATSPILVIHAHYLKEDTLLTLWVMCTLVSLVRYAEHPQPARGILLGLCLGLAWSTHYKSALLLVLLGVPPLLRGTHLRRYIGHLPGVIGIGACVFLMVNSPLADAPRTFWEGMSYEAKHAVVGHRLRVYPLPYWFSFHLRYSLLPGMTPPIAVLGLAGLLVSLRSVAFDRLDPPAAGRRGVAVLLRGGDFTHQAGPRLCPLCHSCGSGSCHPRRCHADVAVDHLASSLAAIAHHRDRIGHPAAADRRYPAAGLSSHPRHACSGGRLDCRAQAARRSTNAIRASTRSAS